MTLRNLVPRSLTIARLSAVGVALLATILGSASAAAFDWIPPRPVTALLPGACLARTSVHTIPLTIFASGCYRSFGEVSNQYQGFEPGDPAFEPYLALAEELDIPVSIHLGTGPPGAPYLGFPKYRARLHSPLLIEEALMKHPKLRVSLMHAGWPMLDDLLAVMWTHPQVYVDVGIISYALPRSGFHDYLRRIVEAGFVKRVMFGSDQMVWPETLETAIQAVESATFLTAPQRRDIFYNNAARFLKLGEQEIARHHGR